MSMTFDEFVKIAEQLASTQDSDILRLFKKLDKDNNGLIDLTELQQLLTTKGDRMTEAEAGKMIKDLDENGDGKLDYREFCKSMQSTAAECKRMARSMLEERERNEKKAPVQAGRRAAAAPPVPARNDDLDDDDDIVVSNRSGSAKSAAKPDFAKLPSDFANWQAVVMRRGYFLTEDDAAAGNTLLCHSFSVNVARAGDYVIAIEVLPLKLATELVKDLMCVLLSDERDAQLLAFSCVRDAQGRHCAKVPLKPGRYLLLPLTSGLRQPKRSTKPEAKLLKEDREDKSKKLPTVHFKDALADMFTMSDLDGSGTLNRQEFSMYMQRTDGQVVSDEDWNVLSDMTDIKKQNGELTLDGFMTLNLMEIEENQYDLSDTWVTLTSLGFSHALTLDRALPFVISLLSNGSGQASMEVRSPEDYYKLLQSKVAPALLSAVTTYGNAVKAQTVQPEVTVYQLLVDQHALLALENKSGQPLRVDLDCSASKNAVCGVTQNGTCAARSKLTFQGDAKPRSSCLLAHAVPEDDAKDWSFSCSYTVR